MLSRASKLNIAQVAARIHQKCAQRDAAADLGRLDIYGVIEMLNIPLLFRPLDGLLGAFLPEPNPGILVTTQRPSSIQRFTAAHELGHASLGHKPSLDDDSILRRMAEPTEQRGVRQEEEANFFATTFMLPVWLANHHAAKQSWKKRDLADPFNLYQLSLRVGLSYSATCVALRQHNLISDSDASNALKVAPRGLKKEVLGPVEPANFYGDVWSLTLADNDAVVECQVRDHIVIELAENSGAGYRWDTSALGRCGATVLYDDRVATENEIVGSPVARRLTLRWDEPIFHQIVLNQFRPWEGESSTIESLRVSMEVNDQTGEGLFGDTRRRRLEAA